MSIIPRRSASLLAVAAVAAVGVLAGCGDDGSSVSETTAETTEATTTGTADGGAASLDSATITAEFRVVGCVNNGESDLVLEAKHDAYTLDVDAPNGTGTLIYRGGNEEDGVDASGVVTSVMVGDAGDFTVEGTWDDDGQPFTLTGNCES